MEARPTLTSVGGTTKERNTWKEEPRALWRKVGDIRESRQDKDRNQDGLFKSREGFCHKPREVDVRPGSVTVSGARTVLEFLGPAEVETVGEGNTDRGWPLSFLILCFPSSPFPSPSFLHLLPYLTFPLSVFSVSCTGTQEAS